MKQALVVYAAYAQGKGVEIIVKGPTILQKKSWKKYGLTLLGIILCLSNFGCKRVVHEPAASSKEPAAANITSYNTAREQEALSFTQVPRRIIAYHQNNIELLAFLEQENNIIGAQGRFLATNDRESREQQQLFTKIPYYGHYGINQEYAVALEPDFIIGWPSSFSGRGSWSLGTTSFWHSRGVNCYITCQPYFCEQEHMEQELLHIKNIGKVFHKEDQVNQLLGELQGIITKVQNRRLDRPKVIVLDFYNTTVTAYGPKRLIGSMVDQVGGQLLDLSSRPSVEELLMSDADIVLLLYKDQRESHINQLFMKKRIFASMKAVQKQQVYSIPITYVYNPGIKLKEALPLLRQALESVKE